MNPLLLFVGVVGLGALLFMGDEKKAEGEKKVGPKSLPYRFGTGIPFHFAIVSYTDRARKKTPYPVVWGDRIESWKARDAAANGPTAFVVEPETSSSLSVFDPVRDGQYPVPTALELRALEQRITRDGLYADRVLLVDQFGALVGEVTRSRDGIWSVEIPMSNATKFTQVLNQAALG